MDQDHPHALRQAGQALLPNHRGLVVSQRRPATPAHRRGAGSQRPPPRRLLLLARSHSLPHANSGDLRATLALGGLLPRRETVSGFRRSAESGGQGHYTDCSPDLLYLRSGPALARPVGSSTGGQVRPRPLMVWYPQKASVSFEDILRTLRHATWQERIFSDPALDAHTRKILKPFVEWAKSVA